jgi:hypothetical protein
MLMTSSLHAMIDLLSMLSRSGSIHTLSIQTMAYYLGFNVIHDRQARQLDISQEHYVEALLERFDMTNCNPVRTPLPASFKPVSATDEEHAAAKHLLRYLQGTSDLCLSYDFESGKRFILGYANTDWGRAKTHASPPLAPYPRPLEVSPPGKPDISLQCPSLPQKRNTCFLQMQPNRHYGYTHYMHYTH